MKRFIALTVIFVFLFVSAAVPIVRAEQECQNCPQDNISLKEILETRLAEAGWSEQRIQNFLAQVNKAGFGDYDYSPNFCDVAACMQPVIAMVFIPLLVYGLTNESWCEVYTAGMSTSVIYWIPYGCICKDSLYCMMAVSLFSLSLIGYLSECQCDSCD